MRWWKVLWTLDIFFIQRKTWVSFQRFAPHVLNLNKRCRFHYVYIATLEKLLSPHAEIVSTSDEQLLWKSLKHDPIHVFATVWDVLHLKITIFTNRAQTVTRNYQILILWLRYHHSVFFVQLLAATTPKKVWIMKILHTKECSSDYS